MKKILSLLLVFLLLFGCSSPTKMNEEVKQSEVDDQQGAVEQEDTGREVKETIKLALWEDPATLDPQSSNKMSFFVVQKQIFNFLFREDDQGGYQPELATAWEFVDDTTLRVSLRENVLFHNGDTLTAEDVRFSIERACTNPKSASVFKHFDADATKVVDDYTIDIKFKSPYAGALHILSSMRSAIISKNAFESMGEADFSRSPVGTGPYKMVEWEPGTSIKLTRNNDYWNEQAIVKNVEFKIIPEATNRVIELETGGVDVAYNVPMTDIEQIKSNPDLELLMGPSYRYVTLTFSMKNGVLQNQDLRNALAYAINKDDLVKAIYGDTASVATGFMPKTAFAFKEFGAVPYDVEKAKTLMKAAGYEDGVSLKFVCEPIEEYVNIAEAIQNMWKEIGVTLDIHTIDNAAYLAQGNEFEVGLRAGNGNEPSSILVIYDSAFKDKIQPNDDYIDEMLGVIATSIDTEKRAQKLEELQDYLWEKRWTIPLAYTNVIYAASNNVRNWAIDPMNYTDISKVTVYK